MTDNKWQKFRKKEVIEAFQMTKELHDELIKKMISTEDTHIIYNNVEFLLRVECDRTHTLSMKKTLKSECCVSINDWVIEFEDRYTMMSDDYFKNNYERVGE